MVFNKKKLKYLLGEYSKSDFSEQLSTKVHLKSITIKSFV